MRYADDTVLLADSKDKLQNLLNTINKKSKELGIELNQKKAEYMVITNKDVNEIPVCQIEVNGTIIKQVNCFRYLGTALNWDTKDDKDLNSRIALEKATFNQMKSVLCNKNLSFNTRYRVVQCYVYPIFLYNSETWTINKQMMDKINAFEMWCIRKMKRISWTAKKTNAEVLRHVNKSRSLMKTINERQLKFVGHVLKKGKLEYLSLTGKIAGKRDQGRQWQTYLQQHINNSNKPVDLIHLAYNRKDWTHFIEEAFDAWNQA